MGTNKELDPEQRTRQEEKGEEVEGAEKDAPAENAVNSPEDANLLNTYKWHTGTKQLSEASKAPAGTQNAVSTLTKWGKMQSWRRVQSEDTGDRSPNQSKPEKKKNPFRRALSEPPGALFSALSSSSASASASASAPSTSSTAGAKAASPAGQEPAQKGKFMKCLQTVSRKIKRPRLPSRPPIAEQVPVAESAAIEPVRLSWVPPQDVPVWDINNCVLQDGQILISREEEPVMRKRNRTSSYLSNLSLQNLTESHNDLECTPDHVAPTSGQKVKGQDGGVKGMIKRRFQANPLRKSSTQLNRHYGSKESLSIPVSAAESLDLNTDQSTIIRPVHSSILGEKYCFEVINSDSNHCFGCSSAAERDRWIENLRRAAQPNKDNCERTENSLCLWATEAKALPPKRRYYCEIHLDGILFARTTSKEVGKPTQSSGLASDVGVGTAAMMPGGQLFWGEHFELDNLPPVTQITLHLFRDEDPKKKRHSKDDSNLHPLGSVTLPLADIQGRAFQEKWYPILPYKTSGSSNVKDHLGPQASLRVKARFQNLKVLPIERYKEFAEYLTLNYVDMCSSLEPLLNVRDKEELAGALVHVLQSIGKAKDFLIDLGSAEVQRLGEKEALIFRENTLATKAIDEYMKLVGQKYLIDTLRDFIDQLYESAETCEVNPRKCPPSDLASNQRNLRESCERVVQRITDMHSSFPVELNEIFSKWVEECEGLGRPEIGQRLISASLFLRFLCPAILSPSLFSLIQPYPEPTILRTLTLIAKVIQNLANFTLFGEKEEYMLFINDFLEQHWEHMKGFLQTVSNPDSELDMARFDGYVDLPLRLAVLHSLLVHIVSPMKEETIYNLQPLPSILNQISEYLGPDAQRITVSAEKTKPTYVPPKDLAKYSPIHNSMQQLTADLKSANTKEKPRKQVMRTRSVPSRSPMQFKQPKRQASSENLTQYGEDPPMDISPPEPSIRVKAPPAPVPWIKVTNKETYQVPTEEDEDSMLDRQQQEMSELRLGMEQVTERELEMAKRLEDFIAQSQEQNAELEGKVQKLESLLAKCEEELASATFRLGVIEEERVEDERKLSVAVAATERLNALEEQFAGLLKNISQPNTNSELP